MNDAKPPERKDVIEEQLAKIHECLEKIKAEIERLRRINSQR